MRDDASLGDVPEEERRRATEGFGIYRDCL
jgi:hypothetical protein